MLQKDKWIILVAIIFLSCSENNKMENELKFRDKYISSNFNSYKDLYGISTDSINKWMDSSLSIVQYEVVNRCFKLDSIYIFNKDKSRFYTTYNTKDFENKDAVFDYIKDFGGAKINGKWYFFFMGVSSPVRREDWQDSVYAPLTFDELSYVAYESHFKNLVKNIQEGYPEKNEKYFDDMFFDYSECKDVKDKHFCSDTFTLAAVVSKYKNKLEPKEIADIKQSILESKLPDGEPLVKSFSWWEKLKYGEKLFESETWKERKKK
ncbi:MAG: hypothetical protein RL308_3198 [Bacteroidota bacterium]